MQQNYSKKIEPIQKTSKNTASSVLDASSQSEGLQRKADMANNAAQREEAPRPNNTGMPDNLKSGIESLSGFSMDDVRVHYNSSKPATVQALAYTQGTDIHVAPGQEKHLPHEAWHVAQQMAGRVSPTTNINGMPVNDNAGLEHEADVMGEKAVQMKSDESKTVQRATTWNGVAQRVEPNDYYYHISDSKIELKIDPMHAINSPGTRTGRGDDLGPGFYMGDSNFLPDYYKKNYTSKDVYIYYIGKNLIDTNLKPNIEDFTQGKNGLEGLFQIAMQLGWRYVDENDVTNHQRPLDLLTVGKTVTDKFRKCVEKIYGIKEATNIINIFEEANKKAIWKGLINDTDHPKMEKDTLKIEKKDIVDYFTKCGIYNIVEGLEETLPKEFSPGISYETNIQTSTTEIQKRISPLVMKFYAKFSKEKTNQPILEITNVVEYFINEHGINKDFAEGLAKALPTKDGKFNLDAKKEYIQTDIFKFVKNNYEAFIQQKIHYIYKSLETHGTTPIQIAIRNDIEFEKNVEGAEGVKTVEKVKLLDEIKKNVIKFTKEEIELTQKELAESKTKVVPIPKENNPVTIDVSKTEETKTETNVVSIPEGNNPVTIDDPKTKGTESGDELQKKLKTVLAEAKQEKEDEDSSRGNK